ncbi:O-methyltransferase COMT-type [Abortiporus biennis]
MSTSTQSAAANDSSRIITSRTPISERSSKLRAAIQLLSQASEQVIAAWEADSSSVLPSNSQAPSSAVPSPELYKARQIIQGAVGTCLELVEDPQQRLFQVASQYHESRALHIAARAGIAQILDEGDKTNGVSIVELSKRTGIKEHKLARVLRTLCSNHVFAELSDGYFVNNHTSEQMIKNEPFVSFLSFQGGKPFEASYKLPDVLFDPIKTQSDSIKSTALQEAIGMNKTLFEWLEEKTIVLSNGERGPNPEGKLFALGMVGLGHTQSPPLYSDYPWAELGDATIVDVGGGVGGMCMDLSRDYPKLNFVIEDRPSVIDQALAVWQKECPEALARAKFLPHDFFIEQPVKNADVYILRYILHDWADDQCVQILSALVPVLGPNSRILICDQVMKPTCDSAYTNSAPYPLLANYGFARRWSHELDLSVMSLVNGRERTAEELDALARKAGLEVVKIWECRGVIWITELRVREQK